jgi:N utilization substance protein B
MALKALYQKDAGKQPLDEVLQGIMDQIRDISMEPMQQIAKKARKDIFRISRELTADQTISPESRRGLRQTASLSAREIDHLLQETEKFLVNTVSPSPILSIDQAIMNFHILFEKEEATLAKLSQRQSMYPDILEPCFRIANLSLNQMKASFHRHLPETIEIAEFACMLVNGTIAHQTAIDEQLENYTKEWPMERQAIVDRNIMRMATFELMEAVDIPIAATVNEAVELAKKFSTNESGKFVNGVLGALCDTLNLNKDPLPYDYTPHNE